ASRQTGIGFARRHLHQQEATDGLILKWRQAGSNPAGVREGRAGFSAIGAALRAVATPRFALRPDHARLSGAQSDNDSCSLKREATAGANLLLSGETGEFTAGGDSLIGLGIEGALLFLQRVPFGAGKNGAVLRISDSDQRSTHRKLRESAVRSPTA